MSRKMLKFFIISSLYLMSISGWAQLERPYVPPSPNAGSLIKFANIETGYYTGVHDTSIPLGQLGGKGISIPVNLNYHASGIKVQDIAGSAGLGWALNAGGAITRVVRGIPDGLKSNCANDPADFWFNNIETCDGEKDIFYFSMLGRSGKMYLDDNGYPRTMPYQDLVLSPGVGTRSIGYWKIVDEAGYQYYFGENATEREQTTYFVKNAGSTSYTQKYQYISTWYLTRIVSPANPANQQVATFSYAQGSDFEYVIPVQRGVKLSGATTMSLTNVDTKIQLNQPKYISNISTSLGSISFDYSGRLDLANAWKLDFVTIKDIQGIATKKFNLVLDYFPGRNVNDAFWSILPDTPNERLRLSSIKEGLQTLSTVYTFNYYNATYNSVEHYPSRSAYFTDHSGYYNRSQNSCNLTSIYSRLPTGCGIYGGINKSTSSSDASVFSLKEIVLPSGGKTTFLYGANERGLTIYSISNYDGSVLTGQSTFSYEGGETFSPPVYSYVASNGSTVYSSSSFKDLYDLDGKGVGYSKVTEALLDGSKIERQFYVSSDFPENNPNTLKYYASPPLSIPTVTATGDANGPPFAPASPRFWMRGMIKNIKVKDNNNNVLQEDAFTYDENPASSLTQAKSVALWVTDQTGGGSPNITYLVDTYYMNTTLARLTQHVVKRSDQADFASSMTKTTNYTYHNTLKSFPSQTVSFLGINSPQVKINIRYPIDVIGSATQPASPSVAADGIWALSNKHVIVPVEELSYLKDWDATDFQLIGGKLTSFKKATPNGQPLATGFYQLELSGPISDLSIKASLTSDGANFYYDDSRYRLLQSFSYDESNNLLTQSTDYKGIVKTYQYGYDNSLMTSSATLVGSTSKYKTEYSYNTINGPISIKDFNNLSSYYEYDALGRLKLVRDNSQNIVTRYRYNTANANEFEIDYSTTNSAAGQPVNFNSLKNAETSGITKYVWDFGDGQVIESTSGSVSHTYAAPGTYNTKLSKINPEYGSVMLTKQIIIYDQLSINAAGCGAFDLCGGGSCLLSASSNGGCNGAKSYEWYYSIDDGISWNSLGGGAQVNFYPPSEGYYLIKCRMSDACGNSLESSQFSINVYRSAGNCVQN